MAPYGVTRPRTTYIGDDLTHDDAFRALIPDRGIGVLVGAQSQSFAQYRVAGPVEVARLLEELVTLVRA